MKVDELDVIDDDYLWGIESLYVDLISGGWEDDRVNDGAK